MKVRVGLYLLVLLALPAFLMGQIRVGGGIDHNPPGFLGSDSYTISGSWVFSTAPVIGSAADAADSLTFDDSSIVFEGATADAYEVTVTVTDPATMAADVTLTIGPSPDGNPWLGATAGDSAGAVDVDNVLLGSGAGTAIAGTGTDNTCVGDLACDTLTTGDNNTIIGSGADVAAAANGTGVAVGQGSITGPSAVAVGKGAEATGAGSVAVGSTALDASTSDDVDNVMVGFASGSGLGTATADTDNTCVGDASCSIANGIVQTTALGADSLLALTTGDDNVAIGFAAGDTLTTGGSNVIIGSGADTAANDNDNVMAIGAGAIASANSIALGKGTIAFGASVVIGNAAGDAQNSGDNDNVLIGAAAGGSLGGSGADINNVLIGDNSGLAANGIVQTTALGADSLIALTTGDDNVAIGFQAGDTLTTGGSNVIIGSGADVIVNSYANTVVVGKDAKAYNTGAVTIGLSARSADGVTIGYQAGSGSGNNDPDNVFIGYQSGIAAGASVISTDNTCIGDLSCDSMTDGLRNVMLGANTDSGTVTDDDQTILGESMVGKSSDSILIGFGGQEHYYHHGAGKVLVEDGADDVFSLSIATLTGTNATVSWNVVSSEGTDAQALSGMVVLWGINKADTEDCNMEELTAGTDEAASAGTLTVVPTWVAGTNECTFQLNAASSLTTPTVTAYYTVTINGPATTITLE